MADALSPGSRRILRAEWVAPMVPGRDVLLRDAAVAVGGGKILAIGNPREILQAYPDAPIRKYDDTVLMPGLVNAHCHLELTGFERQPLPADGFVGWVIALMRRWRTEGGELGDFVTRSVADGVVQCHKFGVTCVGDVALNVSLVRQVLRERQIRAVSYGEVLGMAGRLAQFGGRLAAATDRTMESARLTVGVEPHAPYSLELAGYRRCVQVAKEQGMPLATHLAETADEGAFLAKHEGPFRELWRELGAWSDSVAKFEGGPVRFAQAAGLLEIPALLAHVNYVDDAELELLAGVGGAAVSVVYCPRTHAYFGHPPHRFREMMGRGINVAVGTDSTVSSPDLNLVDDLRLVHRVAPEMSCFDVWRMGTINAARAVRMGHCLGTIEVGKCSDLVGFPVKTEDPLREILEGDVRPNVLWVEGVRIYPQATVVAVEGAGVGR